MPSMPNTRYLAMPVEPERIQHQRRAHDGDEERAIDRYFDAALVVIAQRPLNENRPFGLRMMIMITTPNTTALARMSLVTGRDEPVDFAEDAGREHRSEQAADAAHHHDHEAVDHHRRAHVGKHGLEAGHHHAGDAGKPGAEREGQRVDPRSTSMPQAAAIFGLRMIARTCVPIGCGT